MVEIHKGDLVQLHDGQQAIVTQVGHIHDHKLNSSYIRVNPAVWVSGNKKSQKVVRLAIASVTPMPEAIAE